MTPRGQPPSLPLAAGVTTGLFSVFIVLPFPESHVDGIRQPVACQSGSFPSA